VLNIIYLKIMIPSLIRILLLGALGYGLYTVVPVIAPVIQENLGSAEVSNLSVVKKSQEYLSKLSGGEVAGDSTSITDSGNEVIGDLIEKARESVAEKVQEDVDKAKEGVKDVANEQFCKTILKTLEEECGQYYCKEDL
jgi:hypothetical protein